MSEKRRLDQLIFEKGLAPSRERAKTMVMEGRVYFQNQKYDKPGTLMPADAKLEIRGDDMPYVSRGGLKLEKAMAVFPISLEGKTAMDIGASTGGFTDCMLQKGAAKVYSIDVGYGQLAWKLRTDPRVINLETDQCPLSHKRTSSGIHRFFQCRCIFYISASRSAGSQRVFERWRRGCLPY